MRGFDSCYPCLICTIKKLKRRIFLTALIRMPSSSNYSTLNKKIKFKKKYKKYASTLKQTNHLKKFKFTFFLKKYKYTKNTLFFKSNSKQNTLITRKFFLAKPSISSSLSILKKSRLPALKIQKGKHSKFFKKHQKITRFSKNLMKREILKNQKFGIIHKSSPSGHRISKGYKQLRGAKSRKTQNLSLVVYPNFTRRVLSNRHKKFTLFFCNTTPTKIRYEQNLEMGFKKTLNFKTLQTLFDYTSFFQKSLVSQNYTNYFHYLLQNRSPFSNLYNTYNFDDFYTTKIQQKVFNFLSTGVITLTKTSYTEVQSSSDILPFLTPSSIQNQNNLTLTTHNLTLFHNFLVEKSFLRKNTLNSPHAMFVLTKAPSYRMNIHTNTPISTSPYYGNIYRTSTFNINKPLKRGNPLYRNLFFKSKVFNTRLALIKGHKIPSIKNYLTKNILTIKTQFEKYGTMKLKNIIYSKNLLKTQKPKKLSKRFLFKVNLKLIRIKIRTNRRNKNTKTLKKNKRLFKERYKFVKSNRSFHFKKKKLKCRQFKSVLKKTIRYLR